MRAAAIELLPPEKATPENPDWHRMRSGSNVTASVIAAICGLDRRLSPFGAHFRQTMGWRVEQTDEMEWGGWFEDAVARKFASMHPEFAVLPAGLYAHPDRPWQRATPDRLLLPADMSVPPSLPSLADMIPLECKTTTQLADPTGDWELAPVGKPPDKFQAQTLWQEDVFGAPGGWLAVVDLLTRKYREFWIPYNARVVSRLLVRAEKFRWGIEHDTPPPIDAHPATTRVLKLLHAAERSSDLEGEAEIAPELAEAYHRHKALAKRVDEHGALIENRLREAMGDARYAVCGPTRVASRVVFPVTRVSTERMPPRIAKYVKFRWGKKSTTDKLMPAKAQREDVS